MNHKLSENSLKFHTPFLLAILSTDTILIMIHPCEGFFAFERKCLVFALEWFAQQSQQEHESRPHGQCHF